MKIVEFSLGELQTNCYFLVEENGCLIIDPADDASFILEEIQRRKLNLKAILATHGHFDHLLAAGEIQLSIKAPLYIFKEDQFLVDRLNQTAQHFLRYNPHSIIPKNILYLKEDEFKILNFKFKIISTPGHTPGSCSFYFEKDNIIFTGDTLFKDAVGRTDLSYSSKIDLNKSLKKLFKLPEGTVVYPGHGESTILEEEKKKLNSINCF